jgi:exosortase
MATNGIRKTETQGSGYLSSRATHIFAIFLWLLSLALFRQPLRNLVSLAFHDENSSHILLIPLISACFIYLQRRRVFQEPRYCPSIGVPLLLLAVVLWYSFKTPLSSLDTDRLAVVASLIVLVWLAAFILCYGASSFKAAAFPLLFLLLMIPLPVVLTEHTVSILQKGSAETCYGLFRVMGVPFIRHGFQFSLPGVDIEVAEQCSGIHSGLSLFIAGLLAGQVLLQDNWKKACFILCIFPIAIFKNAVRIVTIAWLGIHVNPDFFHGALHRQGGLPFSLLALGLMALLLWLLRPVAFSRMRSLPPRMGSSLKSM